MLEGSKVSFNNKLSNPFNLFFAFLITIFLYLLRLSNQISEPSFYTATYLIFCLIAMFIGFLLGKGNIGKLSKKNLIIHRLDIIRLKKVRLILISFLCFSSLFYLFEHIVFYSKYGTIPIFRDDFELLRIKFPVSGYIHILAMLGFTIMLPLFFDYFLFKSSWSRFSKFSFILLLIINIIFSVAVGNRGVLALFFVQILLVYYSFKKVKILRVFFLTITLCYLIGLIKFIRDYLFLGSSVIDAVSSVWIFGGNIFLIPLYYSYVTFVMNFEILNLFVINLHEYFLGYFSYLLPFNSLINSSAYDLHSLQKDVLNNDFYGVLTSTGFGVPYFDFGYFGAIQIFILSFIFGYLYRLTYIKMKVYYIPAYSFYFVTFATFIYTYNFNKLYIIIYLLVLFLIARLYRPIFNDL